MNTLAYKRGQHPNSRKNLKVMTSKRATDNGFGKWMLGKTLSEETKQKISDTHQGGNATTFRKGNMVGAEYRFKVGNAHPMKGKGVKCKENQIIRSSLEYKQWRTAVFERDNYTCQHCGERGGILNADHIKPFASYPELRLDINNGRTLCLNCHKKTPTFARSIR